MEERMDASFEEAKTGFYVEPKLDCPHIAQHVKCNASKEALKAVATLGPCDTCHDSKENWACLQCGKRFCSRYVAGHMKEHNAESGHAITVSYSDFSFWCYECDSYIAHNVFRPLLTLLRDSKFGDPGTGGRFTAHKTMTQMEEIEETPEELAAKIKALAGMIRDSKHCVFFTGAGISTSAGIPDFRGPEGVWTLKATGEKRKGKTVSMLSAVPTTTHMAMVKLHDEGRMHYLISQNVDGIHRKSGIHPHRLSELHGNSNLEVCCWCGKEYMRDFDTCHGSAAGSHETGRRCTAPGCSGPLLDTIINFGENLPKKDLERAYDECDKADLIVCLGSSLTVAPANDLPKKVAKHGGNLVIVNLQRTPLDSLSTLRIHGRTDQVMAGVMEELGLEVPPFVLNRYVRIQHNEQAVTVEALDVDGTPISLFTTVKAQFMPDGQVHKKQTQSVLGRMETAFVFDRQTSAADKNATELKIELQFLGHYREPAFRFAYPIEGENSDKKYMISFNLSEASWDIKEVEAPAATATDAVQTGPEHWPKSAQDSTHEHPLKLKKAVYSGIYRCNKCMRPGTGWVYHCKPCAFDLHPFCCDKH
jgi:mono-ADP-ribosyltransferase sirtuin 6